MTTGDEWDPEAPTEPTSPAARAAVLVANWKACSPERQRRIERLAAALAALPKFKVVPK